ncbi:acylphosphatase [Marinilabilia sp.]|jgi:acylphosphatase
MKRVRVIISGRVQGVGFRYFVRENAFRYSIKGYVKNMPGGNVEIDAEADSEKLDRFLEECRQGPPQSRVEGFHIQDVPVYGYTRFRIRHCEDY